MSSQQSLTINWQGRRLFLIDGSGFSMPDCKEAREYFGQPTVQKQGCGFPQAHFLALIHAETGLIREVLPGKLSTHDLSRCAEIHPLLQARDVIVGDRAYCSYCHLAKLQEKDIDAVVRLHQRRIHSVGKAINLATGKVARRLKKLKITDQIGSWEKSPHCPSWLSASEFASVVEILTVRIIRYQISTRGSRVKEVTLATTLLDPQQFPAEALVEAYAERWSIETCFKDLKTTMKMDVLHCKSVSGILKELYAYCIVYNVIRTYILAQAKSLQRQISEFSFIDAIRSLIEKAFGLLPPPALLNPLRPGRYEPRAKKKTPKTIRPTR